MHFKFRYLYLTVALLIFSACAFSAFASVLPNDFYMVILRDSDAQIIAIENDKIDILGDIARPVDIERLSKSPNVELSIAPAFHSFYLSFNTRRFPFDDPVIRRAVWQIIPKEKIVRDLFSGYAEPIDTFLPPMSTWIDTNVTYLTFAPDGARLSLSKAGWSWNSEGILVSPGGEALKPLKLLSPTASAAPTSTEIANQAAEAMRALGIPVEVEPMDFATLLARVDRHDFDCTVNAWTLTRDPDSLFSFYHSAMSGEGGYNISGISDPELDEILLQLRDAPDEDVARGAASEAQIKLAELAPVVPIYSRYSVTAVRKGWNGVYVTERSTADNFWTLIGMSPADGKERPIYWALPEEPRSLNPFVSSSAYDWMVMGHIYDTLISIHPETLEDIPWLATEWDIRNDDGKSVITFKIRGGVKWHDGEPFTVDDVIASLNFVKKSEAPRFYDSVKDIESITSPAQGVVEVKLNKTSYWHLHNIGGMPIFPKHILDGVKNWQTWQPAREPHPKNPDMTQFIGTGPFIFTEYRPGDFVRFKRNLQFWNPEKPTE